MIGHDETSPVCAVRLSTHAATQIREEHDRLEGLPGPAIAGEWEDRLMDALAGLATLPARCAVALEDAMFPQETIRQSLYRRRRNGPTWRILFSIRDATADDPPMVWVHRVCHAAQDALTEWPEDED